MYRNIILPAGILAGTIIGAGVFALPYTINKAGTLTGLFYLAVFTSLMILVHLMFADVILRTKGEHRFTGYAEIYLGNFAKWVIFFATVIGMILILSAYLILSISFINLIYPGWPILYKVLGFWIFGSAPILWRVKKLATAELISIYGIIAIILIIFSYGLGNIGRILEAPILNLTYVFLPYGAILFALSGRVAIPAVVDYLRRSPGLMHKTKETDEDSKDASIGLVNNAKQSIIIGTLAPAILYFIFILAIFGLSGTISQDSVSGLIGQLPQPLLLLLGLLGLISIWSTYIVIVYDVERSLEFDFKFPALLAGLVTIFAPLLLYLVSSQSFLGLVSLVGSIFIGLEGIFIVLMWRRLSKLNTENSIFKKLNPAIPYILLFIFVLGIITEVIK